MQPEGNGTRGPPGVSYTLLGFPRKSINLQHILYLSQEKETKTGKVAKVKKTNTRYKQFKII